MSTSFNPPPGWPIPPPGWIPPPDWKPDPSWPPPPPGWPGWVPSRRGSIGGGILITLSVLIVYFAVFNLGWPDFSAPLGSDWASLLGHLLAWVPFPLLLAGGVVLWRQPTHARTGMGILLGLPLAILLALLLAYGYVNGWLP